MDNHDEVLRQHQSKIEMHRRWMKEQQEMLRGTSPRVGAAATASSVDAPHSSVVNSSTAYYSGKGGSSPAPAMPVGRGTGPYHQAARTPQQTAMASSSPINAASPTDPHQRPPFSVVRRTPPAAGGVLDDEEHFISVNTGSPVAVFMRGSQWAKRREQRLEEQRQARVQEELAECTFSPAAAVGTFHSGGGDGLSSHGGSARRHRAAGGGSPPQYATSPEHALPITELAAGVGEHLQRQEKARQLLREREERLLSAGQNWTAEPTTVEPFHLGQRIPSGTIKALQQPIQAPHRSLLDAAMYQPFLSGGSTSGGGRSALDGTGIPPPGHFSSRLHAASTSAGADRHQRGGSPLS